MARDKYTHPSVYFTPDQLDDLIHKYGWSYNDFDNDEEAHITVSKTTLLKAKREGRMTVKTYARLIFFLKAHKREYVDGRKRNYLKRLRERNK